MWNWLNTLGNWFSGPGQGWFNALGSMANLAGTGYGIYNMMNPPQYQQQGYDPAMLQSMFGQQQPTEPFVFEFPSFGGYDEGKYQEERRKDMARQYAGARTAMQSRGVYSGGAITPEAMAALLGIDDPEELYSALGEYGGQTGPGSLTLGGR